MAICRDVTTQAADTAMSLNDMLKPSTQCQGPLDKRVEFFVKD